MEGLFRRARASARFQVLVLLGLMAVLLGSGLYAANVVTGAIDEMIQRTGEARLRGTAAQDVVTALADAEAGQRAFLLTGREEALAPADAAIDRVDGLLALLRERVADDQSLHEAFGRLSVAARARVADLRASAAAARRAGPGSGPAALLLSAGGDQATEAIRMAAGEITRQAERDRARSARTLQQNQARVTDTLLAALVAAVLLLGAAALLLVWSKSRLRRARNGERREARSFRAAVEHVPDGVAVFDAGGVLRLSNSRFASVLAVPEGMAAPGARLAPLAEAAAFNPPLLPTRPARPSSSEVRQGPRTLEVWRSPMPDGGQMLSVTDVTRRVQAEEVGRQAQKMDVLGQMTGGVAHDFNNLLQIVSTNLELLRTRLTRGGTADPSLLSRLDAAAAGVDRGARLTRHLLAFARRQPLAPVALDPARLLSGLEDVLRRSLGEAIRLELVVGGTLWTMQADPTQFENALLNLALNARDAMAGPDGVPTGQLTVEAANAALDEDAVAGHSGLRPGQYVMFAVSDTGSGMTPDQVARATEPFFTTKPEGRGTGLGLAMVVGFARQSGGHFQLYSQPGRGTTARLFIPRTLAPVQAPEAPGLVPPPGGETLVLLVEDDGAVRGAAAEALAELGYRVAEATDADAALAMLDGGLRPRVLFTDVVMPGRLGARALSERARALVPGVAVLFTSGYTQDGLSEGQLPPGTSLLAKPWRREELARALRDVLAAAARPPAARRVLLVEDEEEVRLATADILEELGFQVDQAETAAAALDRLSPATDLLLTDLGLPDRDGVALVRAVRGLRPALPVIVASGQSEKPDTEVVWLPKPFDRSALLRALDDALGTGVPAPVPLEIGAGSA